MAAQNWFGDHPKASVVKAGAWAAAANACSAGLSLVGTIVLSRLLHPDQVGLFTLAFTFYSIGSLVIGPGLTAAAVQAPHLSEKQSSNLFWINVAVNTVMAVVLAACSPFLAALFHQPLLAALCPVFAVVMILEGMATQYRALLTRAMRFDIAGKIGLLTGFGGLLVAIILAVAGYGVWALVAQVLVAAVADRIALATVVQWRPSWFDSTVPVRQLLHFSYGSSLALAMHMLYTQSQSLLMGRFATTADVGYYSRGQALFQKPFSQIMGPLYAVLLPALSSRQRNPDELGATLYRANSMLYLALPPLALWLMISGRQISVFLLGESWTEAGDALFWFAIAAVPGILFGTLYKANEAIGRPTWGLGIRLAFLPVLLVALVWAAPRGAAAMAAAGAAVEWMSAPVIFWLMLKDGPIDRRFFAPAMGQCLIAVSISFACMWLMRPIIDGIPMPLIGHLLLSLVCCYLFCVAIASAFPFGRAACREWAGLLRQSRFRVGAPSA